jgi:arylsulfatase
VTRMPTIIALPESEQPAQFDGIAETFSIAPTVLDYAGVERPPEMRAPSLRDVLEGKGGGSGAALCEYLDNNRAKAGACIRTERYKYVTWGSEYIGELYDLQEDPGELRNLWDDPGYAGRRQEMGELLLERLLRSQEPAYTSWVTPLPEHVQEPGWRTG